MSAIAVSNSGILGEVSTLGVDVLLFGIFFPNSNSWVEQCGNLCLGGGGVLVSGGTIGGGIQLGKGIQEELTVTV